MFEFLKPRTKGELEEIIRSLESNRANNYKDNAQSDYKDLIKRFETLKENGELNDKQIAYYKNVIDNYKIYLQGYTHKDQTPYWT